MKYRCRMRKDNIGLYYWSVQVKILLWWIELERFLHEGDMLEYMREKQNKGHETEEFYE